MSLKLSFWIIQGNPLARFAFVASFFRLGHRRISPSLSALCVRTLLSSSVSVAYSSIRLANFARPDFDKCGCATFSCFVQQLWLFPILSIPPNVIRHKTSGDISAAACLRLLAPHMRVYDFHILPSFFPCRKCDQ